MTAPLAPAAGTGAPTHSAPAPAPGQAPALYDLRRVFRNIGVFRGERALTNTPPEERPEPENPAELLETEPVKVTAAPLEVAAYVDGVQSSLCVTYRAHRPVYLIYVGAAAMGARPFAVRERTFFAASAADRAWVDSVRENVPVEEIADEAPIGVERAAHQLISASREQLERRLVEDLLDQEVGTVVCDGSIVARPHSRAVLGVVKTTGTRYLADESDLYRLRQGWRSPMFKIPAGVGGTKVDVYSCYLRLFNAEHDAWNHALIRLESYFPETLDPLAARALADRQAGPSGGDARWDRHLAPVRRTEQFLRARRPSVFNIG